MQSSVEMLDEVKQDIFLAEAARKKMKQYILFQVTVIISTLLALSEPVLIGFEPFGFSFRAQLVVLASSTLLYFILLFATFLLVDRSVGFVQRFLCLFENEVMLETVCLIIGWACIFENPGIAALRCFRVFRMLWFFELVDDEAENDPDYVPEDHFVSISKVCHLCVRYLEGVGCELFTAKSRGGVVLLAIYFYITYVLAMVFWIAENDLVTPDTVDTITGNNTLCGTLTGCYFTLMRLTLYDGTGFDFLGQTIAERAGGLSMLLVLYMCFSTMILLNGLIGIFGAAFVTDQTDRINHRNIIASVVRAQLAVAQEQIEAARFDGPAALEAVTSVMADVRAFRNKVHKDLDELHAIVDSLQAAISHRPGHPGPHQSAAGPRTAADSDANDSANLKFPPGASGRGPELGRPGQSSQVEGGAGKVTSDSDALPLTRTVSPRRRRAGPPSGARSARPRPAAA